MKFDPYVETEGTPEMCRPRVYRCGLCWLNELVSAPSSSSASWGRGTRKPGFESHSSLALGQLFNLSASASSSVSDSNDNVPPKVSIGLNALKLGGYWKSARQAVNVSDHFY